MTSVGVSSCRVALEKIFVPGTKPWVTAVFTVVRQVKQSRGCLKVGNFPKTKTRGC